MRTIIRSRAWPSPRVILAAAIATTIMASGDTALASGGDRTIAISGNSVFSDCGAAGSDLALLMTGDLNGCLSIFVEGFTCKELGDFAHYTERGREAFVGTWRGKKGRFTTDYTVDAAYGSGFCDSLDFTLELSGSCLHKIDGRSGVFADARGVFTMFDVVTNVTGDPLTGTFQPGAGANNFLYYGRIRTSDMKSAAALADTAPAKSRALAAGSVAVQKARSGRAC